MISNATQLKSGTPLRNNLYRIIEPIKEGVGGFGCIYKIEVSHDHFGKRVLALKQLHFESGNEQIDEAVKSAFQAEAKTLLDLRIPSVPIVHDLFVENDYLFLVMDYIQGNTLDDIIKNNKPSLNEAILIIEKLLQTVHSLHTNEPKIIHRDIKPANIILQGKKVWLVDFGIAKNSKFGTILPTAFSEFYSPPEQSRGLSTNERGDIYSVGATFYYLLSGQKPTDSRVRFEDIEKHNNPDPLPNIREINPQIPELIANVVNKSMAMNQDKRFATAFEMLKALQEANRKINDVDGYFKSGKKYYDEKNWDKAIAEFNRVIELKPNSPNSFFYLGYCYGQKDEQNTAIEYYSEAIKLNPKDSMAFYNRSLCYKKIGKPMKGIADINRAVELDNNSKLYRRNRVNAYIEIIKSDAKFLINKSEQNSKTYKWAKRRLSRLDEINYLITKEMFLSVVIFVLIFLAIFSIYAFVFMR